MERLDMAHLPMASSSKKPFKKGKGKKKKSKLMMHLTMGKRKKIRCNVIFATRNVTKKRLLWFKALLENKGKTQCLLSYEYYLIDVPPNS